LNAERRQTASAGAEYPGSLSFNEQITERAETDRHERIAGSPARVVSLRPAAARNHQENLCSEGSRGDAEVVRVARSGSSQARTSSAFAARNGAAENFCRKQMNSLSETGIMGAL